MFPKKKQKVITTKNLKSPKKLKKNTAEQRQNGDCFRMLLKRFLLIIVMNISILRTSAFLSRSRFHHVTTKRFLINQNQIKQTHLLTSTCKSRLFSSSPSSQQINDILSIKNNENIDLESLTVPILKSMLKSKGLKVSGTKSDLLIRLQTFQEISQNENEDVKTNISSTHINETTKIDDNVVNAAAIQQDYKDMTLMELRSKLKEKGLTIRGKKSELIARLKLFEIDGIKEIEKINLNKKLNLNNSSSSINSSTSSSGNNDYLDDLELDDEDKMNFLELSYSELNILLQQWGFPSYRSKQVWNWVNDRGIWEFHEMTDLPLNLRKLLKNNFKIGSLSLTAQQVYIYMCVLFLFHVLYMYVYTIVLKCNFIQYVLTSIFYTFLSCVPIFFLLL